MSWKNLSYWLKGGIIGVGAEIVLILLAGISIRILHFLLINPIISSLFHPNSFTISGFIFTGIITILETLIYSFIIGAIIGYIFGKIPNKKIAKWFFIVVITIFLIFIITEPLFRFGIETPNTSVDKLNNIFSNISLIIGGGACTYSPTDEYPSKACIYTTENKCSELNDSLNANPKFNPGLLCTAEELGMVCGPVRGKFIILNESKYFIDSCGNQANPYDEKQFSNKSYWTYSLV